MSHTIASLGITYAELCRGGIWDPKNDLKLYDRLSGNMRWDNSRPTDMVLVGLAGYNTFRQLIDDRRRDQSHSQLPNNKSAINAALLLNKEDEVPVDAWSYTDITLQPHQTNLLRDIVNCPHVLKVKTEVVKISPSGIGLVVKTGINPLQLGDELIPLIGEIRQHLGCEAFGRHIRYELSRTLQAYRETVTTHPTRELAYSIRRANENERQKERRDHRMPISPEGLREMLEAMFHI